MTSKGSARPGKRANQAALKFGCALAPLVLWVVPLFGQPRLPAATATQVVVVSFEGRLEFSRAGSQQWDPSYTNQILLAGDRLRTGERSRALLRFSKTMIRLGELSFLSVPEEASERSGLGLLKGLFYFFHRDKPGQYGVRTPMASALVRGTEFNVEVGEDGATTFTLLDGAAEIQTGDERTELQGKEQVVIRPGAAGSPVKSAVVEAVNSIQWCLYYPAVLWTGDLHLGSDERAVLNNSLAAYQAGDLKSALASYPSGRDPVSSGERIYLAAMLISVGQMEQADLVLDKIASADSKAGRLREALRTLVASVQYRPAPALSNSPANERLATEWLAESYFQQSRFKLEEALTDARKAAEVAPDCGLAWERIAELEFSFGRLSEARAALEQSLKLAPENAEAFALQGFLLAARDRLDEAMTSFDRAIALDGSFGNAWLGRGLCLIRRGNSEAGRADLETAAALEPNRSLLRSYLGKAWSQTGDQPHAASELELAKKLDPNDPTPWLYSALLLHDEYRTAEAIHELEESARLNNNRQVYRSRLLLDQDQAVRSANLANIFQDAGMRNVSVRESARAVEFDYANYSAHLNLASSFNELRDPSRFNLRFESEWFNEHLLASLLAPVGAGSLSQNLSQQEYSELFAGKRFGLSSTTEYFSDGEWRQTASQFGTFGNTSYALDLEYQHKDGVRVNNDLERIEWYSRIKQQITPKDSLLLLVKYQDYDAGDNFQYYDPASARPAFRFEEMQTPLLLAGWHHEWSPGVHTLFLGGRLVNDQHLSDTNANQLIAVVNPAGLFDPTNVVPFDVNYHSSFETYSAELNQIVQRERHTDILGVRYQDGAFNANAVQDNPPATLAPIFSVPVVSSSGADFQRLSLYAYHHWEIVDGLMLIGGLAYDDFTYPANFRRPPLSSEEARKNQWSPKGALLWRAAPALTVRGMYSQAVGGVSYDESVRLEPTQLAGFGQSYRSLISESLVGSVEAPEYEIAGGALDWKPFPKTWLSFQAESLRETLEREFGLFTFDFSGTPPGTPAETTEQLDYHELTARVLLNQVVGLNWFVEASYQFSRAELDQTRPTIPATPTFDRTGTSRADLQEVRLAATWRHPSGYFARGEVWWFHQELSGNSPRPPGDEFPQVNLFVGYRFPKRHGELTVGLLNLADQDYHLSPLNYYLELPRERVFYTRFRFNF